MRRRLITSTFVVLALALAGCGKAQEQSNGDTSGQGKAAIKTGPGVTDKTITLGSLMDLTAVFAPNSKSILQGGKLYWDQVNKDGGVCGREIKVNVQDHGYDAQKAVALYRQISPDVLALSPVLGSSVMTALLPSLKEDNMVVGMAAWTSEVLPNPLIQITGGTYDLEMINAIDFLMREKGLKAGDTIGHIYFEGDFGGNAIKGTLFAAGQNDLKVIQQQIKPTNTDLSSQVSSMQRAGVKAIMISAGSPQTASVASVAASIGLDVPLVGNGPAFTPQLLGTPAAAALEKNLYISSSMAPPSLKTKAVEKFLTAFGKAYPDSLPTQNGSMYGYASAQIMHAVLEKACQNKALTRQGVLDSLRSLTAYDSGGSVAGTLDYSDPTVPSTRLDYISKVDKSAPGGLVAIGEPFASKAAQSYNFGH